MSVADQLAGELAAGLESRLAPQGFRYLKSLRAYRRPAPHGHGLIGLSVSRSADGGYIASFTFGVRHAAAEETRAALGLPTDRQSLTAVQNSFNVYPARAINYPGPAFWTVRPPVTWAAVIPEANRFVQAVALPWVGQFADALALREAVAADDGRVAAVRPWETVAALDLSAGREAELVAYLTTLRERSGRWAPERVGELTRFVRALAARLPSADWPWRE